MGQLDRVQFTFTGPVTINVYAPTPSLVPGSGEPVELPEQQTVAPEAVIRFDPDYETRVGYDPLFLDPQHRRIAIPTPGIAPARLAEVLQGRDNRPLVLKYHHFELVMNERRRLQMWSAVNVNYDPARKSTRSRDAFGTDRWVPDPRIPARGQIFDADFYKPAGNIDRGHVVRREDNAWGTTEREIEFANSDTFHWTNCTPQHEAFNQSYPGRNDPTYQGMKGLWGDFENHIQRSLTGVDTKACILAGPVLDNDHDPAADFGRGPIKYPLRFWKVVAVTVPAAGRADAGARALRVFAFVLSQKPVVERFGIEAFGPGDFKRYQVSLRTLEGLADVTFDAKLHAADTLREGSGSIRIERVEQVRGLSDGPVSVAAVEDPDV